MKVRTDANDQIVPRSTWGMENTNLGRDLCFGRKERVGQDVSTCGLLESVSIWTMQMIRLDTSFLYLVEKSAFG